jgi:hypothetical protein
MAVDNSPFALQIPANDPFGAAPGVSWTNNIGGKDFTSVRNLDGSVIPPGAQPGSLPPTQFNSTNSKGQVQQQDLRTKILVPSKYLNNVPYGIAANNGIIFPYTPQITYDSKADYSALNPTHGNYTQYFYQHSSIGPINIQGKFTVQNGAEAVMYLATTHLLKSLTKMQFGDDEIPGAPPPVCRLNAYGAYMIQDVPIVINSYRIDLPIDVDYFTFGKNNADPKYDTAMVPISSNISITCYPLYSRDELSQFTVEKYINNYKANSKYL